METSTTISETVNFAQKSIDYFVKSTGDTNKEHNPEKTEKPLIPGFQIETVGLKYANSHMAGKFPKQLKFSFEDESYANDSLEFKLDIENNDVHIDVLKKNKKVCRGKIAYADRDKLDRGLDIPVPFFSAPYSLKQGDINLFLKSADLNRCPVPEMFPISLVSNALINYFNVSDVPEDKKAVYIKHDIRPYAELHDVKEERELHIMIKEEPKIKKNIYIFKTCGVADHRRLFDADLYLALIDKN